MSGAISYDIESEKLITGSFTAAAQTLDLTGPNSGTDVIQIAGTWTGTIIVEGSQDGTNFVAIPFLVQSTGLLGTNITANGTYIAASNAYSQTRVRTSAWSTGTANIAVYGSNAPSIIYADARLRGNTDGTLIGNSGDKLRVSDGLANGGVYGNLSLATGGTAYEAKAGGSRLTNRKSLTITALDDMYWGYDNGVTTSNGTPLYKNQQIIFACDPATTFQVWLVASASNKNARITEST